MANITITDIDYGSVALGGASQNEPPTEDVGDKAAAIMAARRGKKLTHG